MKNILIISLTFLLAGCGNSNYDNNRSTSSHVKSGIKRFVLTSCLGKKLDKIAHFYVDGAKWKMDFNNGDKIFYDVISGNEATPLCGINTIDSFKDKCEICITKKGDDAVVQFKYAKGTLSYEGYYDN
jgi:hypothetical protein